MDHDPRLDEYRRAAEEMAKTGRIEFDASLIDEDPNDPVGRLGRSLHELTRSMESRFSELELVSRIGVRINQGLHIDDILEDAFDAFQTVVPYDRIGFATLEDDGKRLRSQWVKSTQKVHLGKGYCEPIGRSSLQRILMTEEPRIINDLVEYFVEKPSSKSTELILREGMRSSLTCPLLAMGKPIGFLFFSSCQANVYEASHTDFFSRIAEQMSLVIEKSLLYEELLETKQALERANRKLAQLASLDGLTGIPNRRRFDEHLEREWKRTSRSKAPLSLIMLDIDAFKAYNDALGHLEGDVCLRRVAQLLSANLRRAGDFLARYGGEEFVVVLPAADVATVMDVAEHLRAAVEHEAIPHPDSPVGPHVTISLGTATCRSTSGSSPAALIAQADEQLFHSKRGGRNRVSSAPP